MSCVSEEQHLATPELYQHFMRHSFQGPLKRHPETLPSGKPKVWCPFQVFIVYIKLLLVPDAICQPIRGHFYHRQCCLETLLTYGSYQVTRVTERKSMKVKFSWRREMRAVTLTLCPRLSWAKLFTSSQVRFPVSKMVIIMIPCRALCPGHRAFLCPSFIDHRKQSSFSLHDLP